MSVRFIMKPLVRRPVAGVCLNLLASIGRMPWYPRRHLTFCGTGQHGPAYIRACYVRLVRLSFLILIARFVIL